MNVPKSPRFEPIIFCGIIDLFDQVFANANQFSLDVFSTRVVLCKNTNFVFINFFNRKARGEIILNRATPTLRKYLTINPHDLKHWHSIIAIVILGLITYGKNALTLTILVDEWAIINRIVFNGIVNCPRSNANLFLRPLATCWSALLYHTFGLNVIAYHAATLILILLRAILFYLVLDRLFPKWRIFSLANALLFLVYPTGFHHLLFESGYQIVSHIFFFLTCLLLITFYRDSNWKAYSLALVLLALSLLLYEAHMGMVILTSLIFWTLSKGQSIYRRSGYLVPILIVALFGIGRWLAQLQAGKMFGHTANSVTLSPKSLLGRLARGYSTSLSAGLVNALDDLSHRQKYSHVTPTLILGAVVAIVFAVFAIALINKIKITEVSHRNHPIPFTLTEQFIIASGGLIAIGAGYIPMITVVGPSITFLPSRVNIIPAMGAVLVLTASFSALPKLLGWKGKKAVFAFVAIVLPFIFLGSATQRASQIENEIAWNQQKGMWRQIITLAPDMAPDTHVLLILPDEGFHGRYFGTWAFGNTLSVLYGHNDVVGQVVSNGYTSLTFTDEGVLGEPDYPIPYDRALLLAYDEAEENLEQLQKIPQDVNMSSSDILLCPNCILNHPTQQAEWRVFVQE